MLRIDGDEECATTVFRGTFPVAGTAALEVVRAVAGIQVRGEPIAWFDPPPRSAPPSPASRRETPAVDPPTIKLEGKIAPAPATVLVGSPATLMISPETAPLPDAVMPFKAGPPAPSVTAGPKPAAEIPAPAPTGTLAFTPVEEAAAPPATLMISPETAPLPRARALPFQAEPPASSVAAAAKPAAEIPARAPTGTLAITPVEEAIASSARALPFARRRATEEEPEATPEAPEPASQPFWPGVQEPAWLGPLAASAPPKDPRQGPAPETVPYFAAPAAASPEPAAPAAPVTPAPPAFDPASYPLERYAALAAELVEGNAPRDAVLATRDLDERARSAIERHWFEAIKKDGKRGSGKLQRAYDAAYVATVEGFRGPVTAQDYAKLALAVERHSVDDVLDELRIQRPALMSVIRVWTKRVSADTLLQAEVSTARAKLLGE
jgi:hypothetical protein